MTLKLDKRLYGDRRIIFDCFSAEDAKKYVGQKGYFADEIPFKLGEHFYQFFLPAARVIITSIPRCCGKSLFFDHYLKEVDVEENNKE